MTDLYSPLTAGRLRLPNRILMAPMTRSRADERGNVGELTALYYEQRAGAGLIVSEGIYPEPMGQGYVRTPGLATAEHVAAWRRVTGAVHAAGGRIVAQLMHAGRISHPSLLPGGATPVAPSAVQPEGATYTDEGMKPHAVPRALAATEIRQIVGNFAAAARRAVAAGFDGVELHAGAGYLPMQFLSTNTNLRGDAYGGRALGRVRFTVETLEAIADAVGADRTGLKITPEMRFNDIADADPVETYTTLLRAIRPLGIAFLEAAPDAAAAASHAVLRPLFDGAYFAGGGFDQARGARFVAEGRADAILYGQLFISNPDLPARFARRASLQRADPETYYAGGASGYVDYPALDLAVA
jgi:N-ethylmaleimide reductase